MQEERKIQRERERGTTGDLKARNLGMYLLDFGWNGKSLWLLLFQCSSQVRQDLRTKWVARFVSLRLLVSSKSTWLSFDSKGGYPSTCTYIQCSKVVAVEYQVSSTTVSSTSPFSISRENAVSREHDERNVFHFTEPLFSDRQHSNWSQEELAFNRDGVQFRSLIFFVSFSFFQIFLFFSREIEREKEGQNNKIAIFLFWILKSSEKKEEDSREIHFPKSLSFFLNCQYYLFYWNKIRKQKAILFGVVLLQIKGDNIGKMSVKKIVVWKFFLALKRSCR